MEEQISEQVIETMARRAESITGEISKVFVGQKALVEKMMITLMAGGHLLVEGVPGLGKTLLIRALAQALGGDQKRVQFTPDLMPSDITGHVMYDTPSGRFISRKGPVFTHFLLADEINRAPAKTQAALFEAMQEYQVSFDGETHPLPRPFLTMATQNPWEHEGTYPLPDAQKDRFLMKIVIPYPSEEEEVEMVELITRNKTGEDLNLDSLNQVCTLPELIEIQKTAAAVRVDQEVTRYAVRLVQATRESRALSGGAGPRASLALVRTARARALLRGRTFATPDDIKQMALPVLRHRITLAAETEIEGVTPEEVIGDILRTQEAPRQ